MRGPLELRKLWDSVPVSEVTEYPEVKPLTRWFLIQTTTHIIARVMDSVTSAFLALTSSSLLTSSSYTQTGCFTFHSNGPLYPNPSV